MLSSAKQLILICLISCTLSSTEDIWVINAFSPQTKETNKFILNPGEYTPIELNLTSFISGGNPTRELVKLKLEDSSGFFQLSQEEIEIDSRHNLKVKAYIGVSCETPVQSTTYTVKIVPTEESKKDFYHSPDIEIGVTGKVSLLKSFEISKDVLSTGTFEMLFMLQPIYNVRPLEVSFVSVDAETNEEITTVIADPVTIPQFISEDKLKHIKTRFYAKSSEHSLVKLKIKESSECFSFSPSEFEITVNDDKPISTKDKTLSIRAENTSPSTLHMTITSQIHPAIVYCAVVSEDLSFPNEEEIRNPKQYDKTKMAFFSNFFVENTPVDDYTIKGLNREYNYKYKCIYENNAERRVNPDLVTTSIIESTDSFSIKGSVPFYSKCGTWFVNTLNTKELESFLIDSCNVAFIDPEKIFEENGCVQCKARVINEIYNYENEAVSICAETSTVCTSFYSTMEENQAFELFVSSVNSKEKLESKGFSYNITFEKVLIEYDASPEIEDISIDYDSQTEDKLNFTASSSLSYPIKCFYSLVSSSTTKREDLKKTNFFYLKSHENKTNLSVAFPGGYDDNNYVLTFQCFSLPGASIVERSSTFDGFIINHSDISMRCKLEESYYIDPYCINLELDTFPELSSKDIFEDNTEYILELKKLKGYKKQLKFVNETLNKASEEPKPIDFILQKISTASELIQYVKCQEGLYEDCIQKKRLFQKGIWTNINQVVRYDELDSIIEAQDKNTCIRTVKLLPIAIFYSFNSAESIPNDNCLIYINNLLSKLPKIIDILKEKLKNDSDKDNTILDVSKLYIAMGVNSFKIEQFSEISGDYSGKVNTTTYLIDDTQLTDLVKQIDLLSNYLVLGKEKVIMNNFSFKTFELSSSRLRNLKEEDTSISYKSEGIEINLDSSEIKGKGPITVTSTIIKNSPVVSLLSRNKVSNIFTSVKLIDDSLTKIDTSNLKNFKIIYDVAHDNFNKDFKYCYEYIQRSNLFDASQIKSTFDESGLKTTCQIEHLGMVTIGNINLGGVINEEEEAGSNFWTILLIIVLVVIVVGVISFFLISKMNICKGKSEQALVETGDPVTPSVEDPKPSIQMTDLKD